MLAGVSQGTNDDGDKPMVERHVPSPYAKETVYYRARTLWFEYGLLALVECVRDNWKWDEPILVRSLVALGAKFKARHTEKYDEACDQCVSRNKPGMLAALLDERERVEGPLVMDYKWLSCALWMNHHLCAKVIVDHGVVFKPSLLSQPIPEWLALWLERRRGARVATVLVYRALRTQGAEKRLSANVAWEIWRRRFTL